MSFQATKFVLGLAGLTPAQKLVAFVLACHANQYGGNAYPSMARIAQESGYKRRHVQRIVRQLENHEIVVAATPKTGGHGHDTATVYRLNFAYKPSTRGVPQDTPAGTKLDDEGVSPETTRGVLQGPEGRLPDHPNRYEEVKKREWTESPPARVQDSHTANLNSKAHTADGDERVTNPQPSKTQQSPIDPVQSSNITLAASDLDKLQAEILRIPLSGGRRFQINSKIRNIIREELQKGRPASLIIGAARYVGRTLTDRDRMPGLTLADNLAATIVAIETEQAEVVEDQERRLGAAMEEKREKRRYELTKAAVIEQENQACREYKSSTLASADFIPSDPFAFDRYQLAGSLEDETSAARLMIEGKRLGDLRREAGELPAIAAAVDAQLAVEGLIVNGGGNSPRPGTGSEGCAFSADR